MALLPSLASLRRPVRHLGRSLVDRAVVTRAGDRPVFVGACPRSGTTLLRSMLNAHPDLALPRETRFVLEAYRDRHTFGDLRVADNRRRLATWLLDTRKTQFGRLGLAPDDAMSALCNAPPTLGSVIGTAFRMFADRSDKPRWGDKRPMYVQALPVIYEMFPDAQFIVIVRDPRGVVASLKKLGWPPQVVRKGTVEGAVQRWLASVRSGRQGVRRYRADQILEIRYEDLVTDPTGVLAHLCRFLRLPQSGIDSMLQFHRGGTDIPDKQRSRYHPNVARPVTDDAVRSWTDVLTPVEVAIIERAAGREMARYGYEPHRDRATLTDDLHDRYMNLRHAATALRGAAPSSNGDGYPLAARLTSAQRRRYAILRRVGLER